MSTLVVAFYFIALPLAGFGCSAGALWAGARGHWSTPLLALPAILVGGALAVMMFFGPTGTGMNLFGYFLHAVLPLPFFIGVVALVLWWRRRGKRLQVVADGRQ
jgi:peptidoglycan/LPS O-acetylase OafA/YrhL